MIEDRLRRDAARTDTHAPDLDVMLARATAPRSRVPWLAAAAAVLLVAALGVAFVVWPRGGSTQPSGSGLALPSPGIITRGGHAYQAGLVAAKGVQTDGADPRRLSVFSFDHYDSGSDPRCNQLDSTARVVAQNSRSVTIETFAYRSGQKTPSGSGYFCSFSSVGAPPTPSVELSAPIGARTVIDSSTGRAMAVFAAGETAPEPDYLPAGFKRSNGVGFSGVRQDGEGMIDYLNGPRQIEVAVASANWWTFDTPVTGHAQVGRYTAELFGNGSERCVGWTTTDARAVQVCSLYYSTSTPLSTAELLKIARSIPS